MITKILRKKIEFDLKNFKKIIQNLNKKKNVDIFEKLFIKEFGKSLYFLQDNIDTRSFELFYKKYILEASYQELSHEYNCDSSTVARDISKAIYKISVYRYSDLFLSLIFL